MAALETKQGNDKPGSETSRSPDTLTRWFLAVWRWLDESRLRQIWPFALGILLAVGAVQITGKSLWATAVVVVVYFGIYRMAAKAIRHDQAIRKTLD